MKTYYFVGGPLPKRTAEFFTRLKSLGGPPPGWQLFPHATGNGNALHLVQASSTADITAHLDHFADIYQHGPIIEVVPGPRA